MCGAEILEWFFDIVIDSPEEFKNKKILEVGSRNVNGSVRNIIEKRAPPKEYIGVDLEEGEGVDFVVPAEEIADYFGEESFDVVISTEMLEHVEDWRLVIDNMKKVLRPGGVIYVSTRSYGFQYHAYPFDYWRYSESDMRKIFADFKILETRIDRPCSPGVLLKATKPTNYKSIDLNGISLYSIAVGKRISKTSKLTFKRKGMLALRRLGLIKQVI
jgi:SAM-dependent methyltransferase